MRQSVKNAMNQIIAAVADTGHVTEYVVRLYIEARMSRKNFDESVNTGLKAFAKKNK